jgi:hypothetical protein
MPLAYLPINGLLYALGDDFALVDREEFVGEEGLPVFCHGQVELCHPRVLCLRGLGFRV